LQASRGDVHTVVVNGKIEKHNGELVGNEFAKVQTQVAATVDYLQSSLGDPVWDQGMNPDIPAAKILDNPYTYTEYRSASTHQKEADRQGAAI
jgi:5-methylthioadenosine/S-adenosylhomocysteine deaminase